MYEMCRNLVKKKLWSLNYIILKIKERVAVERIFQSTVHRKPFANENLSHSLWLTKSDRKRKIPKSEHVQVDECICRHLHGHQSIKPVGISVGIRWLQLERALWYALRIVCQSWCAIAHSTVFVDVLLSRHLTACWRKETVHSIRETRTVRIVI